MSENGLRRIPDKWIWTTIGEVTEVVRGASPRPKGDLRYFGGSIPWIMISDISRESGKYISVTRDTVTEEGAKRSRYLKSGILILSNSGTVCVPKILAVRGCIHDGFVAFPELSENLDINYLYYWFENIRPRVIQENRQGITQVNLNTGIVRDIAFPLPPLPEQHRIIAEIEKQFTRLDAGVAALERAQTNLKRYRASVLKAACEGRLVPTEAESARAEGREYESADHLLARILKERRAKWESDQLAKMQAQGKVPKDDKWKEKYQEPAAPDTTDLPELPEGWGWTSLIQLGFVESGQTPKGVENNIREQGEIPWFKVGDMNQPGNERFMKTARAWISRDAAHVLGFHIHPAGTIIFPKRGGAIATNKKRFLAQESCYDLNTMGLVIAPQVLSYVWWWFAVVDLDKLSDGSNVPQINHGDIEPLPVPIPPLVEQHRIVAEIERRLSVIDELEATVSANLKRAERLRQSILKRAFEGKLVTQDPHDEPASMLLERIRAERTEVGARRAVPLPLADRHF